MKVPVQFSFGIGEGQATFMGSFLTGENRITSKFYNQGYAWALVENGGAYFFIFIDFGYSSDRGGNSVYFFTDAQKGLSIQLERMRKDIAMAQKHNVYDSPEHAQILRKDIQQGLRDDPLPSDPSFKTAMEEEERKLPEALKLVQG